MSPDRAGTAARVVLPLAAGLFVSLAVLAPPEIRPWSGAAVTALLGVAAVLAFAAPGGPPAPAWLGLPVALGALPVLAASCRAHALDEAVHILSLLLAGIIGRALARDERGRGALLRLLAGLGALVAFHAWLQALLIYPLLAGALRAADPADPGGALVRLEAGRPSGPFSLPAALGGFIALTLPLVAAAALGRTRTRDRVLPAAVVVLQISALLLARSIGALLSVAAGLLCLVPLLPARRRLAAAGGLVLALAAGGVLFAATRHDVKGAAGSDPLTLRMGNWRAASAMIAGRPVLGVGPGAFATHYPRHLRPGMNESRHAHNSYLEAAAGWGLWILAPIGLLLAAVGGALRRSWRAPSADPGAPVLAVICGGVAFLVHNLGDFTAFLPGVALPAAMLIGLGLGMDDRRGAGFAGGTGAPARGRPLLVAGAVLLAAVLTRHALAAASVPSLFDRAAEAAGRGDFDAASGPIEEAMRRRAADPGPPAFLAQMVLAHFMEEPAARARGEAAAARALALDPEAAVLHHTRALYHAAAGERAAAWCEQAEARRLFPLKDLYRIPASPPAAGERR